MLTRSKFGSSQHFDFIEIITRRILDPSFRKILRSEKVGCEEDIFLAGIEFIVHPFDHPVTRIGVGKAGLEISFATRIAGIDLQTYISISESVIYTRIVCEAVWHFPVVSQSFNNNWSLPDLDEIHLFSYES
jgi:hypothetical protein